MQYGRAAAVIPGPIAEPLGGMLPGVHVGAEAYGVLEPGGGADRVDMTLPGPRRIDQFSPLPGVPLLFVQVPLTVMSAARLSVAPKSIVTSL